MKINIQSPGFKADQNTLIFATKKLQTLPLYTDKIIEAQMCLKIEKSKSNENKTCEVKLVVRGNDFFAAKKGETFEDAISKVVRALKSQLSDRKLNYTLELIN